MTILLSFYLNADARRNDKKIFSRMVDVSDSLKFDYSSTINVMRALFGSNCIIDFSIS